VSATRPWNDAPQLLRVERACDQFEDVWRAGGRPVLDDLLRDAGEADRPALLEALLPLELHYRRAAGENPAPDEYLRRFPDAAELIAAAFGAPGALTRSGPGDPNPPRPTVPGYELLAELGRGGMGVVYLARQVELDRTVALKMILAGPHAGPAERARFVAEARATARMHHPNIVQIHEVGEADGLPYLVLEFVEGGSLAQALDGTPQAPRAAARLVELLARAMAYAHERGIIHRDLKPANILLEDSARVESQTVECRKVEEGGSGPSDFTTLRLDDFRPKITDFGLAKVSDPERSLTVTGAVMGSPNYMAPEQARGDTKKVGPAADVYALGVILFELLTGRVPFTADSAVTLLRKVGSEQAPSPRALCPAVPRELEAICLKCLEKDPARRYPSATALAEDLSGFLAGKLPTHASPFGPWARFRHRCRRHPVLTRVVAVAGVVALVALVVLGAALPPRDDSLWRVRRSGKLVVGIDPNCPPYAFKQDGELTGFDVELARALAGRLGVEADHRELYWTWDGLKRGLQNRELDVIISATTITEERKRQVAFIEYASDPLVFTGRTDAPFEGAPALRDKVLAVQEDTTAQAAAERLQRAGAGFKEIKRYRSAPEPFAAVRSRQADFTLDHQLIARYACKDGALRVLDVPGLALGREPLGIALRSDAVALQQALEEALRGMNADGEFDRIRSRWVNR
jgi:serine/threonine protein kinase/ABC-type amino acid transport substrate-binding protein